MGKITGTVHMKTEVKCGTKKAQKVHLRNQHFNEFRHWCLYCDYGRDELSNVQSHMSAVDTNVKPIHVLL